MLSGCLDPACPGVYTEMRLGWRWGMAGAYWNWTAIGFHSCDTSPYRLGFCESTLTHINVMTHRVRAMFPIAQLSVPCGASRRWYFGSVWEPVLLSAVPSLCTPPAPCHLVSSSSAFTLSTALVSLQSFLTSCSPKQRPQLF